MSRQNSSISRGVGFCRACDGARLKSVLDLGEQPLANEFLHDQMAPDFRFPLHLRICVECGLGQLGEFVTPERIFGDYPYLSSVSTSWVQHARTFAHAMRSFLSLGSSDLVVEIASNDGYLLREFGSMDIATLGIEPAENVAMIARASGVPTIATFFGRQSASQILRSHQTPRLIVANNVLAHVPDLDDFVGGLALLCGDDTLITIENPSFINLLIDTQFDTIYHEHYSYLSAHAIQRLVARHGLQLMQVEKLSTHGGSYRYWVRRSGVAPPEHSVEETIQSELDLGLLEIGTWKEFESRTRVAIRALGDWMDERSSEGSRVVGYGAAAKGNTLLNALGSRSGSMLAVADGSSEKQGKWLPGSRIRVIPPVGIVDLQPTHVLILPWNIAEEIAQVVRTLVPAATCWTAIPAMRKLA